MDEENRTEDVEEESLAISITITQASSLYIMCAISTEIVSNRIRELRKSTLEHKENIEAIYEDIQVNQVILNDIKWFMKEAKEILMELDKELKPKLIQPPKWSKES